MEEYQKRLAAETSLTDLKSRESSFRPHETVIKMEESSPTEELTCKGTFAV